MRFNINKHRGSLAKIIAYWDCFITNTKTSEEITDTSIFEEEDLGAVGIILILICANVVSMAVFIAWIFLLKAL